MLPPKSITARYDVVTEQIRAGSIAWSLLAVRDSNSLVDAITPAQFEEDERLPYWADLWASSIA
ncbi:MAG TPA: methyltransferase type 12, partial [Bacteroidota bacterium]|nr:methyltransferase type 12 [Bacteroidota bacterium]